MFSTRADPAAAAHPAADPAVHPAVARRSAKPRYERLVGAARDLANERASAGFTVHEVAVRAGSSLKGFYGCFASKDDLLVALLAEDSRIGAALFEERVRGPVDHVARLRATVTTLIDFATLPGAVGYARVLATEHRRLSEERPDDMRAALAPVVDVIVRAIEDATRAGAAASTAPARDAATVFALVLDAIHDVTLGRADPRDRAEHLWQFCGRALGVADPGSQPVSRVLSQPVSPPTSQPVSQEAS